MNRTVIPKSYGTHPDSKHLHLPVRYQVHTGYRNCTCIRFSALVGVLFQGDTYISCINVEPLLEFYRGLNILAGGGGQASSDRNQVSFLPFLLETDLNVFNGNLVNLALSSDKFSELIKQLQMLAHHRQKLCVFCLSCQGQTKLFPMVI